MNIPFYTCLAIVFGFAVWMLIWAIRDGRNDKMK